MLLTAMLLMALRQGQSVSPPQPSAAEVAVLQAKAQAGDADAKLRLGEVYERGAGVKQSDEEAAKWYEKAASQGNSAAEVDLGVLLWSGRGVPEDKTKAVEWYRKAARQGNGSAMFNLGSAYYNGEGVATDELQALAWFLLAEEHGSVHASDAVRRFEKTSQPDEFNRAYAQIAEMLIAGTELSQDYVAAAKWYARAAKRGDTTAAVHLARILAKEGGEYKTALGWCQFAADRENPVAMYCMGWLYHEGKLGPKDSKLAADWFEKGAYSANAQSCLMLGRMYWDGDGVEADKVTAYKWALVASKMLPQAQEDVASFRVTMSEKEIHKAEELARGYFGRHQFGAEMSW